MTAGLARTYLQIILDSNQGLVTFGLHNPTAEQNKYDLLVCSTFRDLTTWIFPQNLQGPSTKEWAGRVIQWLFSRREVGNKNYPLWDGL